MFEVFDRTGPQNLGGGGPQIWTPQKINLPFWTTMIFIWRKLPADKLLDSTRAWIGFHFATHCNADQRTKCCNQMRTCEHTMQQNATAVGVPPRTPLGELSALPRPHGWRCRVGQNFGWVGHNAFVSANYWTVYSLILFANSLKLVPPMKLEFSKIWW